jgi:hypothetical protein
MAGKPGRKLPGIPAVFLLKNMGFLIGLNLEIDKTIEDDIIGLRSILSSPDGLIAGLQMLPASAALFLYSFPSFFHRFCFHI